MDGEVEVATPHYGLPGIRVDDCANDASVTIRNNATPVSCRVTPNQTFPWGGWRLLMLSGSSRGGTVSEPPGSLCGGLGGSRCGTGGGTAEDDRSDKFGRIDSDWRHLLQHPGRWMPQFRSNTCRRR